MTKKKWPTVVKMLRGKPGDVLNVGANIGQEVKGLLHNSRGRLYAIEAVEENARQIRKRFGRHPRVQVRTQVMASTIGQRTFYINNWPGTHSLLPWNPAYLVPRGIHWSTIREIEVTTNTLDQFCKTEGIDRVAFLFMDLQGAELEVLRGAKDLLRDGKIDLIMGEQIQRPIYKDVPPFHEIRRYLEGFGYRLTDTFKLDTEQYFDFVFEKGAIT